MDLATVHGKFSTHVNAEASPPAIEKSKPKILAADDNSTSSPDEVVNRKDHRGRSPHTLDQPKDAVRKIRFCKLVSSSSTSSPHTPANEEASGAAKALPAKAALLPGNVEEPEDADAELTIPEVCLQGTLKSADNKVWDSSMLPPKESLYEILQKLIENHENTDVRVRIGNVEFKCHMMVLQCYSEMFRQCSKEAVVRLPEQKITPGTFMLVYKWMLSERSQLRRESIVEVFSAATYLRVKELIGQCWFCFDSDVLFREDTAFLLYLEARKYDLDTVEQLMLARVSKFFLTLVASREFVELSVKEVCTLLSSSTIAVNAEVEVLLSAVRWLNYDWENREPSLLEVVKCVRFCLMPPWLLVLLNNYSGCKEVSRVVSHASVKKIINDGIFFTTTKLTFGRNSDQFLQFMEEYQLVEPAQRELIYDKQCGYHHHHDCPNVHYVDYKAFLQYLQMLQTVDKSYWRNLKTSCVSESDLPCCVHSQ